jgi:hypothetical protein
MKVAIREKAGISNQRGFWLRCFLVMRMPVLIAAMGALHGALHAQATNYDCFYVKAAHVARVRGEVLDQHGAPVVGAKIELIKQGDFDALESKESDADGNFRFSVPGGAYGIQVKAQGFQPTELNLHVDRGLFSFFNMRKLYVVLAVGAKSQPCPPEISSRKELQEYIRKNATQK